MFSSTNSRLIAEYSHSNKKYQEQGFLRWIHETHKITATT
jgi:hypothetical protein